MLSDSLAEARMLLVKFVIELIMQVLSLRYVRSRAICRMTPRITLTVSFAHVLLQWQIKDTQGQHAVKLVKIIVVRIFLVDVESNIYIIVYWKELIFNLIIHHSHHPLHHHHHPPLPNHYNHHHHCHHPPLHHHRHHHRHHRHHPHHHHHRFIRWVTLTTQLISIICITPTISLKLLTFCWQTKA